MCKNLIKQIIGNSNSDNFEKNFVLYTSLISSLISFAGIFLNIYLNIGIAPIIIASICFICYFSIYIIGRLSNKYDTPLKYAISIVSIFISNFFWVFNYNSHGPVLYLFVVYFSLLLFIWDSKRTLYLYFFVLSNIIVLFSIEYFHPELINNYTSEKTRIIDVYSGLIIYLLIIYIFTMVAKNNYLEQYKKAKESERLKTAFLHNLSHEIRTPLNAIVGFSSLLVDYDTSNNTRFKKIITENSDHLIRLIEDMIDMSMIETNQLSLKKTNINLYNTLKNLNEIFKIQLSPAVQLEIELCNKDFIINTDKTRLEQILMNLLKNAIKFTEKGHIRLSHKIENKLILFYVEDTGIGIEKELQERIFDRFTKGNTNSKNVYRGAGIGLFLTKKMVEILGGRIWLDSQINKGSTFYFTVPITN